MEVLEDQTRQRTADDAGHSNRQQEPRRDAGAELGGIPEREIKNDAGPKACFRRAKQRPGQIELPRGVHECHGSRNPPPQKHDPRDGLACADAPEQQRARHLQQDVANEEQTHAQTVSGIAQTKIVLQMQLRKADIDAIKIVEHPAEEQKAHQPESDLAIGCLDGCRVGSLMRKRTHVVQRGICHFGVSWRRFVCCRLELAEQRTRLSSLYRPPQSSLYC